MLATMNIFGWMHRKLNPSMDYYSKVASPKASFHDKGIGEEEYMAAFGKETEAPLLLEQLGDLANGLHHVFDGILMVGTLGHVLHGHAGLCLEDDSEGGPEESEKPIRHVGEVVIESQCGRERIAKGGMVPKESVVAVKALGPDEEEEEKMLEPLLKDGGRVRTTLMDLFLESDQLAKKEGHAGMDLKRNWMPAEAEQEKKVAVLARGKWGRREGNPLPPSRGKEVAARKIGAAAAAELPTPKKLRQLLSKMTRKKVHPEAVQTDSNRARGERRQQTLSPDRSPGSDEPTGTGPSLLLCIRPHLIPVA